MRLAELFFFPRGLFKGIRYFERSISLAYVEWTKNYITFLDNLLQTKILMEDSRNLYVPSQIRRLCVDPNKFQNYVSGLPTSKCVPVTISSSINVIKCDSVEIFGLEASPIARRKHMAAPVLETYSFVPNVGDLDMDNAIRVNIQIILEQFPARKEVGVLEIANNKNFGKDFTYLSPIISEVISQIPLMKPTLKILTKENVEFENISVEVDDLDVSKEYLLAVLHEASSDKKLLEEAFLVTNNGFVLVREKFGAPIKFEEDVTVVTKYVTGKDVLVLLRKSQRTKTNFFDFNGPCDSFEWLLRLKKILQNTRDVCVLLSRNLDDGILGFVNCLRREPNGEKVRSI